MRKELSKLRLLHLHNNCSLQYFRDRLLFLVGPEPPRFEFYFDPNNAGPLYFLVCLTLGIVIPGERGFGGRGRRALCHCAKPVLTACCTALN